MEITHSWSAAGRFGRRIAVGLVVFAAVPALAGDPPAGQTQVPTTVEDFFQPGTQPDPSGTQLAEIVSSTGCSFCHGQYLPEGTYEEPWDAWVSSMMGQAARDPVWHAALAIANQDAHDAGTFCIRCHSPSAFLGDRVDPPDTSAFIQEGAVNDWDGVVCHFCHRAVDPVLEVDSPVEDAAILAALPFPPGGIRGNGRYVVDPTDVRRGPYLDIAENDAMNMHGIPVIYSPFHRKSEICATCHDVMNPVFERQPDDTYAVGTLDTQHSTQDTYDMFPEQATYSEWLFSQFANGGVQFNDGRFGGNHPTGNMQECQDCHMPDQVAGGCFAWEFPPFFERQDLPHHGFAGANHWALKALRFLHDDSFTGLSQDSVDAAVQRTVDMLGAASDVQVVQQGSDLKVRVINWSGHKLPTGYPEGRRMWINVQFLDDKEEIVTEYGAYDYKTAELEDTDTTVFEAEQVVSDEVSIATGVPTGSHFHLALASSIVKDNRIPPVGFTNAGYEAFGGQPIGVTYADGQHWHDSVYTVPAEATHAVVTLYYQAITKEYVEFLRDNNVTNSAGQDLHDAWASPLGGNMVPPVDMDMVMVDLTGLLGDIDQDGSVGFSDLIAVLASWGPCPGPDLCPADLDCDGDIGFSDLLIVLAAWS